MRNFVFFALTSLSLMLGVPSSGPDATGLDGIGEARAQGGAYSGGVVFLDQNWSAEERQQYYFTSQGSAAMHYEVFLALEQAGSRALFRSDANMSRYGLVPSSADPTYNPDALPIGIAKATVPDGQFRGTWVGPANLGSAWSAYEFTSWNDHFEIEDLFWEQRIGPTFSFCVGNQGPQATINTFRFKDARTSFTASPLAFSETIPYPAFGAGLSFRWRPIEGNGMFINGVLNDMNGNPSQGSLNWSHLQLGQLFGGVEFGQQWRRENGEYDQLALDVFHAGTRSIFNPNTTPNKAGAGFKILGEKQWGRIVGFAAYTYNTAQGGGISTTFSGNTAVAGAALLRPFGIVGEAAVAGMWSLPFKNILPGSGQRAQYGMETYWNIALTPNSTVTPGIQLIFNPSFNPTVNFIAVPDVKFRVAI